MLLSLDLAEISPDDNTGFHQLTGLLRFDLFYPGKVVVKFQKGMYRQYLDLRDQGCEIVLLYAVGRMGPLAPVAGETYLLIATGSITGVGSTDNTYSMTWAAEGNTYTAKESNYVVTDDLGTLTITAATLSITVNDKTDYLKITDEDGDISRVYVQGIDNTDELEDRIEKEIEKGINKNINGDYGTWDNSKAAAYGFMGMSIVMIVIVVLIISIISLAIAFVFKAFLINPIILGCQSLFLNAYERPADLKDLGNGFKNKYMNNVKTLFLRDLFVFLWSLLFIIPGIIKLYEYRMMPYLIAENPSMTHKEAFAKSKEMMMGNKWNAFVLDLSFIGWFILNSLTCGILGLFYVNPYYFATDANLYRAIKKEKLES